MFGFPAESVDMLGPCPTRTSVLVLSVTCALLALVYVCTLFCALTKRWLSRTKPV